MTPAPRREGPENNEDRDNWGEHWGELVLEHGQPGTEWVNEPEISAKIIKIFRIFFRFQLKKSSLSLSHGQRKKPQNKIVCENSRLLRGHPWFHYEMTSEERQQKFHTDTSSVWNFVALSSDIISRGNQWWLRKMSSVFSDYKTKFLLQAAVTSYPEKVSPYLATSDAHQSDLLL